MTLKNMKQADTETANMLESLDTAPLNLLSIQVFLRTGLCLCVFPHVGCRVFASSDYTISYIYVEIAASSGWTGNTTINNAVGVGSEIPINVGIRQ